MANTFRGFPDAALDFYAQLEANNTRAWWQEHKPVYDECVKEPFAALSDAVESEFGPLHLFRPYRDVRFSADKTPYKTAAGAVTESEGGCAYYAQISSEGLFLGVGHYAPAKDQLERLRAAIDADRSGKQIEKIVAALRKKRWDITAMSSLKTAPRGYAKDHPRVELLRLKGLTAGKTVGAPQWLHTRRALDRIVGAWRETKPMTDWLDRHVGPSEIPPPEPD